jgi:hypothetical protein
MRLRLPLVALGVALHVSASSIAMADSPGEKAAAQILFDEAQALVDRGNFAEACPKLAQSQRLDPGLGTQLWLADCYENLGQLASAWAVFREAAAVAASTHDEREKVARERAASLEPKLARLVIGVRNAAAETTVERDGTPVSHAEWGVAVPVDPGAHVVRASAPGKKTWSVTVQAAGGAGPIKVEVPPLDDLPAEKPISAPLSEPARGGEGRRTAGIVLAGGAVVMLGVGAVFGLRASSLKSDADPHCPNKLCDAQGRGLIDDATTAATVSTISLAAGVLAGAGGAYLFFSAPRRAAALRVAPYAASSGAGLVAGGQW